MAWTTPRTWVANEFVTATLLNTHLRDDMNAVRDYLLGAQDLASNWKISSGRTLSLDDAANVAHGMTSLAATSVYGAFLKTSSTLGGLEARGLSEGDAAGFVVRGVNGSTTPTQGGIIFDAAKKSGTTYTAMASSETALWFLNGGGALGFWYGSGLNVVGGLSVGYSGQPTSGALTIGDSSFALSLSSSKPTIQFDSTDFLQFDRSASTTGILGVFLAGSSVMNFHQNGVAIPASYGLTIGGGTTFGVGATLTFVETTDSFAPTTNACHLFAQDVAGKTGLYVRFPTGAAQQIKVEA